MENKIVVNGEEYVKVTNNNEVMAIVIIDSSGLSFVGKFNPDNPTVIRDARCIIRWGTSEHLAELAVKGIMPNTKLGAKCDFYPARITGWFPATGWEEK